MSAYPAGYIEQLARPFRLRKAGNEERAHAPRGRLGEHLASDAGSEVRHTSKLSSGARTRSP